MSFNIFLISVVFFFLLAITPVLYDAYKGKDWKTTAMFMLIGWFIAVGQIASSIK